jgi:hypothetical protein
VSAHTHAVVTPGCYRCELSADEVAWAQQEVAEQAAREAACPEHEWIVRVGLFASWQVCHLCNAEEDL